MEARTPNLRIYLVEDSDIMSRLLTELASMAGAEIVGHAADAPGAIEEIPILHPDVVLVDIGLRRGNGFDVVKALKQRKDSARCELMVLSNYTLQSYRDAATRLGVTHYFDKSTDIIKLVQLIAHMSHGHRRANGASD